MRTLYRPLVVALLIVMVLSACAAPTATPAPKPAAPTAAPGATQAPAPTDAPKPAARPELKGELTIATWGDITTDPKASGYAIHLLFQKYAETHPNVKLNYEVNSGKTVLDRYTWIRTRMMSSALPDVVHIYYGAEETRDPKFMYDFTADLKKPNPYSTNKTWWEDFPADGVILKAYQMPTGEFTVVGPTQLGGIANVAVAYNKTAFDKAGVSVPKTWAEFMVVQKKLKDAGYAPFFQPTAGPLGWQLSWPLDIIVDPLMDEAIKTCDQDKNDILNLQEITWCIKKGHWKATDPRYKEAWKIMKDWSQYWQEGFLAPPPEGDPFLQGKVAMKWWMTIWMPQYEGNPNLTFEWGTFYLPPITKETSALATGAPIRRMGSQGQAAVGVQYVMIPKTTVDKGKLPLALDLAQYVTSPDMVKYWCTLQAIPCFEPGTPIEQVFPNDPKKQELYRGFFEPSAYQHGMRELRLTSLSADADAEAMKLMQEYLGGKIELDAAMVQLQKMLDEKVNTVIRQHPEWGADKW